MRATQQVRQRAVASRDGLIRQYVHITKAPDGQGLGDELLNAGDAIIRQLAA